MTDATTAALPDVPPLPAEPPKDNWKYRRRFLVAYTASVLLLIKWVVLNGHDTVVAQTLVSVGLTSLAGLNSAYIFGAAWENKGKS